MDLARYKNEDHNSTCKVCVESRTSCERDAHARWRERRSVEQPHVLEHRAMPQPELLLSGAHGKCDLWCLRTRLTHAHTQQGAPGACVEARGGRAAPGAGRG